MNKIITISREFGSGGRELGKRLAEQLGIAYYDREIITAIAEKSGLAEDYVANITENGVRTYYPITYGRTFSHNYGSVMIKEQVDVIVEQQRILKQLAEKSDCVIVGRCAEIILKDYKPLSLFVHADMESRIDRCLRRDPSKSDQSRGEMRKQIRQVDRNRARAWALMTDLRWGDKQAYQLCVNTTDLSIKQLIPAMVEFQRCYFQGD
ncbi:cytidylate kinase-like family protein [Eubacteriales bacterium OttesenSCG-928-N13]|nr:cytidylate kinase-like family protein [Eubacteriales bacterium OttesenSCG-928-N13]